LARKISDIFKKNSFNSFFNTKPTPRSGFKIPDKVQGQGVRPDEKAQHTLVCEHLSEACNAAIGP
jgi:hypothetical protein